jgi:hypothetical protein
MNRAILYFLVFLPLSLLAEEATYAAVRRTCDPFHIDGPTVTVRLQSTFITGAELKIPRDYVDSPGFKDGGVREALLLSVWRETFLPYKRQDEISREQRKRYRAGYRDRMVILVANGNPLNLVAKYAVTSEYGIPVASPDGDLEGILLPNGLYGQRMKATPGWSDVYLGRDGDHVTDVIRCRQRGDVPRPSCMHVFEAGPFDLTIRYPLEALDSWKSYRDRAAAMVLCFTTRMPTRLRGDN